MYGEVTSKLKPDYSYVIGSKRVHKFSYRKKRFKEDKTLLYQEGLTEKELTELNGLDWVYGAGKIKRYKAFN